ncbi:MAG: hypothetical protein M0T81_07825 [Thermoplasmatales archaeon]|nr:hypothetical protein [Thermoplasmatales archaeon]
MLKAFDTISYGIMRLVLEKLYTLRDTGEIYAHSVRCFYGTYMYRTTNDLRLVQLLLGDACIEATTIYEHLSSKETAEKGKYAVEKLFRGGIK